MSQEKSYLDHSGIPMQATPNAGRVRRAQGPWPSTFSARPAQPGEQKHAGTTAVAMPGFTDEIAEMDEVSKTRHSREQHPDALGTVNESLVEPTLLQRASGASSIGAQSGSANSAIAQSALSAGAPQNSTSSFTSAAMGPGVNPPTLSASPVMNVGSSEPRLANGMETGSASEYSTNKQEDGFANPVTSRSAVQEGAVPSALQPQVLVQKHITVQTEFSPMSAGPGMVMPSQSRPVFATSEKMESHMAMNSAASTENESVFAPGGSFAVPAIPQTTSFQFEALHTPMGAGNAMGGQATAPVMPATQPHGEKSQQALLDRLNSRPAPQQENSGGRRLHIGNLQITVQRPAVAPAQTQPSLSSTQPSTQTQPAAAPQTFFNPWERHHMAFD
jgi:hypothetical protein